MYRMDDRSLLCPPSAMSDTQSQPEDSDEFVPMPRHRRVRRALLVTALIAALVWGLFQYLATTVPRHIVLASGPEGGVYHRYAMRYKELLAREGVTVEERITAGADENLQLMLDPKSGVDVAFMQGGVASNPEDSNLKMLASLYYEPLWVFHTGTQTISKIPELRGKRIAVGAPGSGTRKFAEVVMSLNGIAPDNTTFRPISGKDALQALAKGDIDAAVFVGGAESAAIHDALWDGDLKLLSIIRADAYVRRLSYITKLTLPEGTIDLAGNIPPNEVTLIGTTAMLVAREGFPTVLTNLLMDTARVVHSGKGYFEAAAEFPGTTPVDFPVSDDADRHKRFGPSFLHRYFPYWFATVIERLIIVVVPLLVILIPLLNLLPQILRWRVRSRIFRLYGELKLLERDVATRTGTSPIERWLADLDRIEREAVQLKAPVSYASEAYTLREHIGLVRRAVMARAGAPTGSA
jgi:TRAP transporter TAXI family solute receptor